MVKTSKDHKAILNHCCTALFRTTSSAGLLSSIHLAPEKCMDPNAKIQY